MKRFKIMLIILLLLVVLIVSFFVVMALRAPSIYVGPITDHFDGKQFFNYEKDTKKSALRWWLTSKQSKWPQHLENAPYHPSALNPQSTRITFVNHATVLIQASDVAILTDPVWSHRVSPLSFIGPARVRDPGIPFDELPQIDVVLISHNHYDHLDLTTLQKLDEKFHPLFIVPLGNKEFLIRNHILNVVEMDWWQQHSFKSVNITFLPARHWSARWLNDRSRTLWGSYGINNGTLKVYFAGDTGFSARNFTEISQKWGEPDVALLPIGAYKPEWFMQASHMNPQEAVEAHLLLHSKHSIPIHYGTFQLSDEGIDEPLISLDKALHATNIGHSDFLPLPEGKSRDFDPQ